MDETIWAVALYEQVNGAEIIEFVRAKDRDHAEAQAINLNEGEDMEWVVNAAAELPADL